MTTRKPALVYCGHCKHFRSGFSDRAYEHCDAEVTKPTRFKRTYFTERFPIDPQKPSEKNANNDCPDWSKG